MRYFRIFMHPFSLWTIMMIFFFSETLLSINSMPVFKQEAPSPTSNEVAALQVTRHHRQSPTTTQHENVVHNNTLEDNNSQNMFINQLLSQTPLGPLHTVMDSMYSLKSITYLVTFSDKFHFFSIHFWCPNSPILHFFRVVYVSSKYQHLLKSTLGYLTVHNNIWDHKCTQKSVHLRIGMSIVSSW